VHLYLRTCCSTLELDFFTFDPWVHVMEEFLPQPDLLQVIHLSPCPHLSSPVTCHLSPSPPAGGHLARRGADAHLGLQLLRRLLPALHQILHRAHPSERGFHLH